MGAAILAEADRRSNTTKVKKNGDLRQPFCGYTRFIARPGFLPLSAGFSLPGPARALFDLLPNPNIDC
jgi:hypothetical protein